MKTKNELFPHLNLDELELFAHRLGKQYPFIEQVSVHYYAVNFFDSPVSADSYSCKYVFCVTIRHPQRATLAGLINLALSCAFPRRRRGLRNETLAGLINLALSCAPETNRLDVDYVSEEYLEFGVFIKHFEIFSGPPEADSYFFPDREEWVFILKYGVKSLFPEPISADEPFQILFERVKQRPSYEEFLSELTVEKESDETIIVRTDKGKIERFNYSTPGFGFPSLGRAKVGWGTFLRFLSKRQPFTPNEKERKALQRLCSKFSKALSLAFEIKIPEDYELIYKVRRGEWFFQFQTKQKKLEELYIMTKEEVLTKLEGCKKLLDSDYLPNSNKDDVLNIIKLARQRKWADESLMSYIEDSLKETSEAS
jgi:hypothetical protein